MSRMIVSLTLIACLCVAGIYAGSSETDAMLATPTPVAQLPGDTCATAYNITTSPWTTQYDDTSLTNGTPPGAFPCQAMDMTYMSRDGWFKYVSMLPGTINLHFEDTPASPGKDIILIVYTGPDCAHLTEIQCLSAIVPPYSIDWSHFSPGGEIYWIQVGDWGLYAPAGQLLFSFEHSLSATATPTSTPTPSGPGDHCGNPESISVGQCVTGSTVGYINDYDCSSGSSHYGADRVYQLVLPSSANLNIFAEADWNADFAISTICDTVTGDILCTDSTGVQQNPSCSSITHNAFGYFSWSGALAAGTYYIWIDSASGANGNYALEVAGQPTPTPTQTPCVTCPPLGKPEGEPICADEYQDYFNGGCNWPDASPVPGYHFQPISCGEVICGNAGNYEYESSDIRDMDWYQISISESTYLIWTVSAAFDTAIWMFDADGGCDVPVEISNMTAPFCQEVSVEALLSPGQYWLVVAPHTTDDPPCGTDYIASVYCGPSPTPSPTPDCDFSEEFSSVFPPTGWTTQTAGVGTAWGSTTSLDPYSGSFHAFCPFVAANHDEWLITGPVNLSVMTHPEIRFFWKTSYYWMMFPLDNADLILQISTNNGSTWTPLWTEETDGVFSDWYYYEARVDLTAYATVTNAQFAWQYVGNDATDVYLDLVRICNQDLPPAVPVTTTWGIVLMIAIITLLLLAARLMNR